ncbi:hypothetical protein SAZ_16520 [Streptomyces noursei ZPM]|nr:hypothetical protein SAZ_16520 [Streptomyces noursei ZPM]
MRRQWWSRHFCCGGPKGVRRVPAAGSRRAGRRGTGGQQGRAWRWRRCCSAPWRAPRPPRCTPQTYDADPCPPGPSGTRGSRWTWR